MTLSLLYSLLIIVRYLNLYTALLGAIFIAFSAKKISWLTGYRGISYSNYKPLILLFVYCIGSIVITLVKLSVEAIDNELPIIKTLVGTAIGLIFVAICCAEPSNKIQITKILRCKRSVFALNIVLFSLVTLTVTHLQNFLGFENLEISSVVKYQFIGDASVIAMVGALSLMNFFKNNRDYCRYPNPNSYWIVLSSSILVLYLMTFVSGSRASFIMSSGSLVIYCLQITFSGLRLYQMQVSISRKGLMKLVQYIMAFLVAALLFLPVVMPRLQYIQLIPDFSIYTRNVNSILPMLGLDQNSPFLASGLERQEDTLNIASTLFHDLRSILFGESISKMITGYSHTLLDAFYQFGLIGVFLCLYILWTIAYSFKLNGSLLYSVVPLLVCCFSRYPLGLEFVSIACLPFCSRKIEKGIFS